MRAPSLSSLASYVRRHSYHAALAVVKFLVRPTIVGDFPRAEERVYYVLLNQSFADLTLLDLASAKVGATSPLVPIEGLGEDSRYCFLQHRTGPKRKQVMYHVSPEIERIHQYLLSESAFTVRLVPVSIFWGRANSKERSFWRWLLSDDYGVSSSLRRSLSLFGSRTDVLVHFGEARSWNELVDSNLSLSQNNRHVARLLRVHFRRERLKALGPRLMHRNSLVRELGTHPNIKAQLSKTAPSSPGEFTRTRRQADVLAANMTYPGIRLFRAVLNLFWKRVYDGIDIQEIERIAKLAETHTLVYVPNHRSHIDYLILSYVLYYNGFSIPYIAAGDNLNLPILGKLLKRCGAFFIRRSFRDDPVYRELVQTYINQLVEAGSSIEFFVEGARSRSGWMLQPLHGLLNMLLRSQQQGLERKLAFVPVYAAYEKTVENVNFVNELHGVKKQKETLLDFARNIRFFKQYLGQVSLRFGEPIQQDSLRRELSDESISTQARTLATTIVHALNEITIFNGINLIALACTEETTPDIEKETLFRRIELFRSLLRVDSLHHDFNVTTQSAEALVERAKRLGYLVDAGDRFTFCSPFQQLIPWFRHNVIHALAIPSLLASVFLSKSESFTSQLIENTSQKIREMLSECLFFESANNDVRRWLVHLQNAQFIRPLEDGSFEIIKSDERRLENLRSVAVLTSPHLGYFQAILDTIQLNESTALTRDALEEQSRQTFIHRFSQTHPFTAVYFDNRYVRNFTNQLIASGALVLQNQVLLVNESMIGTFTETLLDLSPH